MMHHLSRRFMGLLYAAAGINHFVNPGFYLAMMPPYLPAHAALVALSGVAEIAVGIGLFPSRTARAAAWGTIALLIAVFPANLYMALHTDQFPGIAPAALYFRLPLQGLLIYWAWIYTRARKPSSDPQTAQHPA